MMRVFLSKGVSDFFGKKQSLNLKGICIVMVFLHHFSQFISYTRFSLPLFLFGPAAVNIFFFIAGYATILGFEKSGGVADKSFWLKKALRLYFPLTLIGIKDNNFLVGLIWMYLASFLAYRFFKPGKRLRFILIMNIVFIVLCIFINPGNTWWFDRVLPYSFGAYFAYNKDRVIKRLEKRTIRYTALIGSLILACFLGYRMAQWDLQYLPEAIGFSLFECVFVITLCYIVQFESRIMEFLGNISFEIFFIHQYIFSLIRLFVSNNHLLFVLSLAITVGAAYLIQLVWDKLIISNSKKIIRVPARCSKCARDFRE